MQDVEDSNVCISQSIRCLPKARTWQLQKEGTNRPPNSDVPPPPSGVCLASDGTAVSIAVVSRLVTPLSCCPYTVGEPAR